MAAIIGWQVRIQGAIIMVVFFLSLAWLYVPDLSPFVRALVLWTFLAVLLASVVVATRRTAREVIALRQRAMSDMEKELHDVAYRETTSNMLDKATGVYTYEYLYTRLREELDRARRHQRQVSLVLVDLAQFHLVNLRLGRVGGNQVLRRFAQSALRSAVRSTDIVARYGGDEFAVLLPETDAVQAASVVQRIEAAAARGTILQDGQRLELPIAWGVATCPEDGVSVQALFNAVEEKLAKAKRARTAVAQGQAPA